jgi:hypothetical protein
MINQDRNTGSSLLPLLLILFGIIAALFLLLSGLGLLPPDATRSPTAEGTGQRKIDMLLAVQANDKAGYIYYLLSHPNMALFDEDTSMMNRLGETELVDTSLEAPFEEISHLEGEHVIEFHAGFVKHTDTDKSANQGVAFEETLGVLFVESQKLSMYVSIKHSCVGVGKPDRAARRIFDSVSWTRQTSRLFRRPYSPTIFNSESLVAC